MARSSGAPGAVAEPGCCSATGSVAGPGSVSSDEVGPGQGVPGARAACPRGTFGTPGLRLPARSGAEADGGEPAWSSEPPLPARGRSVVAGSGEASAESGVEAGAGSRLRGPGRVRATRRGAAGNTLLRRRRAGRGPRTGQGAGADLDGAAGRQGDGEQRQQQALASEAERGAAASRATARRPRDGAGSGGERHDVLLPGRSAATQPHSGRRARAQVLIRPVVRAPEGEETPHGPNNRHLTSSHLVRPTCELQTSALIAVVPEPLYITRSAHRSEQAHLRRLRKCAACSSMRGIAGRISDAAVRHAPVNAPNGVVQCDHSRADAGPNGCVPSLARPSAIDSRRIYLRIRGAGLGSAGCRKRLSYSSRVRCPIRCSVIHWMPNSRTVTLLRCGSVHSACVSSASASDGQRSAPFPSRRSQEQFAAGRWQVLRARLHAALLPLTALWACWRCRLAMAAASSRSPSSRCP